MTVPDFSRLSTEELIRLADEIAEADHKAATAWSKTARPEQIPPDDYRLFVAMSGRGWGKTKCAAEEVKRMMLKYPDLRIAVVAQKYKDVKEVCFEGDSGLCTIIDPADVQTYNRSEIILTLNNGSQAIAYTSEKPDGMRGPQFNAFWLDEFAAFSPRNAEDVLMQLTIATRRKGPITGRGIITTTPRRVSHMRRIVEDAKTDPSIVIRRGRTADNVDNLPLGYMEQMNRLHGGSRIGLQELEGVLLEDSPGALWTGDLVAAARAAWPDPAPQHFDRVVVGVDPSGGGDDATGVIVVGLLNGMVFVLADYTTSGTPGARFEACCMAAYEHGASEVMIESNFGADLNIVGFQSSWRHLVGRGVIEGDPPKLKLSAVRGDKAKRAEPVVTLYEQGGRIAHAPGLDDLESEQMDWDPTEPGSKSPNRVDGLTLSVRHLTDKPRKTAESSVPRGSRAAGARGGLAITQRRVIR